MAKILLIDDDDKLRQFLLDALKQRGHEVSCMERADHGGVDILEPGEFDLVLVDQQMPGMSGSEFLKVLRKKGNGIPAILMTAFAKGKISGEVKNLDVVVVSKPAGGYDEVWKELEEHLADALKGEAEIAASLGHAVNVALRVGKTDLVSYLRALLDHELLAQVSAAARGNLVDAKRILGVPLAQLAQEKPAKATALSFRTEAMLLIHAKPELTVDDYCERLDCSKSKLWRDPFINRALKMRKGGNYRRPSGYKDAEGNLEAFDD